MYPSAEVLGIAPQRTPQVRAARVQIQHRQQSGGDVTRHAGRERVRVRVVAHIAQGVRGAGGKRAETGEGLRTSRKLDRDTLGFSKLLDDAAAMGTTAKNGMSFIDEHRNSMRFGRVQQLWKRGYVSVHRIDPLHHKQTALAPGALQDAIEIGHVVVGEQFEARAGKLGSIHQAHMGQRIGHHHVAPPHQPGDGSRGRRRSRR